MIGHRSRSRVIILITLASLMTLGPLGAKPVIGAEARSFRVDPPNAASIETKKDHISIKVVRGWTSAKDSFFKALLSKNDKLVVSVASDGWNFDNLKIWNLAFLVENSSIGKNIDKPWGAEKTLIYKMPADTTRVTITLRSSIDKSSRFNGVLEALRNSAPTGLDLAGAQWFGYATALVSVLDQLFGSDKTKYPFIWTGDLESEDWKSESYLVLLSKNKSSDRIFDTLDTGQVSFDGSQVRINGSPLTDHSYAVLKIAKSEGYDVVRLSYESKAPWAALAQASFLSAASAKPKNVDELEGVLTTRLNDLDNELVLLKEEPRFSAYDRGVALYLFAKAVKSKVNGNCSRLGLSESMCPTLEIDTYMDGIADRFELNDDLRRHLPHDAAILFQNLEPTLR